MYEALLSEILGQYGHGGASWLSHQIQVDFGLYLNGNKWPFRLFLPAQEGPKKKTAINHRHFNHQSLEFSDIVYCSVHQKVPP